MRIRLAAFCVACLSTACGSSAADPPAGTTTGGGTSSGGATATAGTNSSSAGSSAGSSSGGGSVATGGTTSTAGSSPVGGTSTGGTVATAGSSATGGTTASGGVSAGGTANGGAAGAGPSGMVPGLVGVGYGGMRVVSRDGGLSWSDYKSLSDNGGDDDNLLRAVVYGKGKWLATGWKLLTSDDGVNWMERGKLNELPGMPECGIIEALAFDGNYFYGGCTPYQSPGHLWRSADGATWTDYGDVGNTEGHMFLTFRAGKFVAYGDSLTTFSSTDAKTWQVLNGVQRGTYCEDTWKSESDCHDASWFDGVYLRGAWPNVIESSKNGSTFTTAFTDSHGNGLYQSRAIAAGYVKP